MSTIVPAHPADLDTLAAVWEASVRATHDFLHESDIQWLRPRVRNDYLTAVALRVFKDGHGRICGFVGVTQGTIQMLFVAPDVRGTGVGKQLLHHAITQMGATTLDVNEQNPQAVGFYRHQGFEVVGRSPTDGLGKPFPLLHMKFTGPVAKDGKAGRG